MIKQCTGLLVASACWHVLALHEHLGVYLKNSVRARQAGVAVPQSWPASAPSIALGDDSIT